MNNHNLNTIEVKGYQSIKDQQIPLANMNVLIGQNGAGKSNFISLFKFLRNIFEGRLKNISLKSGAENLLYFGSRETKRIEITLDFAPNFYQLTLEPTINDTLFIVQERAGYSNHAVANASPDWVVISADSEESQIEKKATAGNTVAINAYNVLKDWRVYHFHDTSESAGVKKFSAVADNKFLFEDASNLASFLYLLKATQADYYDRIVKTVQLVIPFFKDFLLRPNPFNPENIRLEWCGRFSDKTFTASQFSDGSLRFICMATLLLQKSLPGIILLDEPELGLHPSAITILAGLLKKAAKRSQVIVSTQSVSLVNEFVPDNIIVVENRGGETVFNRLEDEKLTEWLTEYTLGELWDKNVLGGKP